MTPSRTSLLGVLTLGTAAAAGVAAYARYVEPRWLERTHAQVRVGRLAEGLRRTSLV